MERIDTSDLVQVAKIDRYIDLEKSIRKMSKTIDEEGESVITVNGAQAFTKAHPLISERNKTNATLLSIEKSFGFTEDDGETKTKRSANDLIS